MVRRSKAAPKGRAHVFGGDWTATKLDVLAKYLKGYTTALKDKPTPDRPFRKAYIDAFAGTGYRTASRDRDEDATGTLPFPDLAESGPQELLDGSARVALKIEPHFDSYVFIERDGNRCQELERLKSEFPALANRMRVEQGEANSEIQKICAKDWSAHRAVLFLDPYGMQVEWQTIEAIAKTKAIDLWLLFPLGIGVNRLLTRSGEIPKGWRTRLDKLLGTTSWYEEFYKVEHKSDLFGNDDEHIVKATTSTIARYFNNRLKDVFAGVAEPGVLRNSSNNPLYLLCFAAGNERGAPIALRIANSLLREVR